MAPAADGLDRKAKLVLEAIYNLGGEANTSEIKEYTGIEKNGIVRYRYDKLEERGLIETRTVDEGGTLPITVARLTEKGEEDVGQIIDNGEPTLIERVDELRETVIDLRDTVETFDGRVDEIESDERDVVGAKHAAEEAIDRVEDVETRVREVESDVDSIRSTVTAANRSNSEIIDILDLFVEIGVFEKAPNQHPESDDDAYWVYQRGERFEDLEYLLEAASNDRR
jgi:DNA-binding PadR family transcriptional regulator